MSADRQNRFSPLRILRYDEKYRLSDYKRYFEVVELNLKQIEIQQATNVEGIFISDSGKYFTCVLDCGIIFAGMTVVNH